MDSGSGAGARAAACPTRKERLELRKQRHVGLRRAMWSARVRLDQDRKKKEEEEEREEKETEDMMWEDNLAQWLEGKDRPSTGMKLKNECSIGVDASTSGSDLEMKKMLEIKKDLEMKKMLEKSRRREIFGSRSALAFCRGCRSIQCTARPMSPTM